MLPIGYVVYGEHLEMLVFQWAVGHGDHACCEHHGEEDHEREAPSRDFVEQERRYDESEDADGHETAA